MSWYILKKEVNDIKNDVKNWWDNSEYLRPLVTEINDKILYPLVMAGPQIVEAAAPGYSDFQTALSMSDAGLAKIKDGQPIIGGLQVAASPFVGALLLGLSGGTDIPIKSAINQSTKTTLKTADAVDDLTAPLSIYTGKPAGRGRPVSNINPATGKPITKLDIIDAINNNGRTVYEGTTEAEVRSMALREAADKEAGYHAAIQKQDRSLSRQKDPSEMTRVNTTDKRLGISPDKSVFPKVTTYLSDYLASGFTPSVVSIRTNNFDRAFQEWIAHLEKLKYDTKSKDSVEAINKIFIEKWGHMFKFKQGGVINYLTHFK